MRRRWAVAAVVLATHIGASVVGAWESHTSSDEMGRGVINYARVQSTNTVQFRAPYEGSQHATLTLRVHPKYGKDVILSIEDGQFLCHSYSDCHVTVRFDEGKPQRYSANGPKDHSTTTLFIEGFDRFVTQARKAKRVRIEALFYQEGNRIFEFDSTGLGGWPKGELAEVPPKPDPAARATCDRICNELSRGDACIQNCARLWGPLPAPAATPTPLLPSTGSNPMAAMSRAECERGCDVMKLPMTCRDGCREYPE